MDAQNGAENEKINSGRRGDDTGHISIRERIHEGKSGGEKRDPVQPSDAGDPPGDGSGYGEYRGG